MKRTKLPARIPVINHRPNHKWSNMDIFLEYDSYPIIYFLIHNNKVVYVGATRGLVDRVRAHGDKEFDSVGVSKITFESIKMHYPFLPNGFIRQNWVIYFHLFEQHFIKTFLPKYNKVINIPNNYNPNYMKGKTNDNGKLANQIQRD